MCLQGVPAALLAGSSGAPLGRRLLRKCPQFPLLFENKCQEFSIEVAVVSQLSEDVYSSHCNNTASRAGDWCTRLGTVLDTNETAEVFPALANTEFYFLCAVWSAGAMPALQTQHLANCCLPLRPASVLPATASQPAQRCRLPLLVPSAPESRRLTAALEIRRDAAHAGQEMKRMRSTAGLTLRVESPARTARPARTAAPSSAT